MEGTRIFKLMKCVIILDQKDWSSLLLSFVVQTSHQGAAVLGIALISMGEDLGSKMAHRSLEHLLQYCTSAVRSAVPLAIALLNVSSPDIYPMDILSRLSHDSDAAVAKNAVLALGMIGAGTNNARLAGILRNLSSYYYKDATMLFLVRMAQGLVYMGKGLMTINPYHTDRQLLSGELFGHPFG